MAKLFLIRHAESRSVAALPSAHVPLSDEENGLTDRGHAQANELALKLAQQLVNVHIVSSPLRRAQETADALARHLDCKYTTDPRLAERRFDFPAGTTEEASRRLQLEALMAPEHPLPFGEQIEEHRQRVLSWFREFQASAQDGHTYAIVTHGGTIEHVHACFHESPLSNLSAMFTACRPAHYHCWTRVSPMRERHAWRLDGVDIGVDT